MEINKIYMASIRHILNVCKPVGQREWRLSIGETSECKEMCSLLNIRNMIHLHRTDPFGCDAFEQHCFVGNS